MSNTQAERVEALMKLANCMRGDAIRLALDENGTAAECEASQQAMRAAITNLVAENEALKANTRLATRLVDAVRQFRCERVLERAGALRQTLGYCALVDAWEDCADAGMGTEPGRAGAARNTTQQQGGQ